MRRWRSCVAGGGFGSGLVGGGGGGAAVEGAVRAAVVVVVDEVVERVCSSARVVRLRVGRVSHFFRVWWKRSTLPQVVGWLGLEFFCVTPRSREFGFEAVAVSAARPPAKRVVKTMPLSVSVEAGMPVVGDGLPERGHHDGSGDRWWAGDGEGVAGVVVEPGTGSRRRRRCAVGWVSR